ncbi:uncharacterized protein LOC135833835 [Planococcus citri]|uniref:uncharacterized protein LOC135833835 n=1 Tax=Planococcus citri TaxID=170843 RepID=UPI0031F7E0EB
MSRFFAVLLLLLYAVVCQTAPTTELASSNPAPHDPSNQPPSITLSLPTSGVILEDPSSTPPSVDQPEQPSSESTPPLHQPEIQTPPLQLETQPPVPAPLPQIAQPQTYPPASPPPPPPPTQPDQPEIQPVPEPPVCPSPLTMPPCEQPVPPPQPPAKKRTGWKNGLMNLVNVCVSAIVNSLTDLYVVTGEKPPKKCNRKRNYIISFGKKKPSLCEQTNEQSEKPRVKKNRNSFWYKDYRTEASPRTRFASCATGQDGGTKQCNFCCVGNDVVNCSNCININCSPQINCCSCVINVTVVNVNQS